MSAVLYQAVDPRDRLEKAHRFELENFAKDRGVTEIKEGMPADLMRSILRSKNITDISVPERGLGTAAQPMIVTPTSHRAGGAPQVPKTEVIAEVNAAADLARQWEAQEKEQKPVSDLNITEARQECKRRGIKLARTDTLVIMKAKLDG